MELPLSNSTLITQVDDAFFYLSNFQWRAIKKPPSKTLYAGTRINGKMRMLHQIVLPPKPGLKTDHKDGNGLNNLSSNLRYSTQSQNMANTGLLKNNTSGFKGVHQGKKGNYVFWRAEITFQGKRKILGQRADKIAAADLYDQAAVNLFGHFARVNFPEKYPEIFGEKKSETPSSVQG